jgi:hypothetical protein
MKDFTKNLSRRNIMVTKVFASTMPRFLAVSCLVAALALLPASQALATQAEATGLVFTWINTELGFILAEPQKLVLYGIGSSRQALLGLSDPKITLFRVGNDGSLVELDSNDDWQDHPSAFQTDEALAFFNVDLGPKGAAMVLPLDSGRYRLVVDAGEDGGFGFASAGAAQFPGGIDPGDGEIQGGPWVGDTSDYNVCFNVAPDGSRLTGIGSPCGDGGDSINGNFNEGSLSGNPVVCADEDIDVDDFVSSVPIIDNKFEAIIPLGFLGQYELEGTFEDGVLTGTISTSILRLGETVTCTGAFSATPAQ